ncbi:MAG: hypothetical protein J6V44_11475 [Methanobrevibacter sp.]|nr:hypothetical protein [Methanobrevibacter sp.]
MQQVQFNKSNENPFVGMNHCLDVYGGNVTPNKLSAAFYECKTPEQRQMFFSLLFSFGDITNRQHNVWYPQKKDNGGRADRDKFEVIFQWMYVNCREQFKKFLMAGLFNEYTCFDLLFKNRVKTKRNGTVISVANAYQHKEYCDMLVEFCYKVINGNNRMAKMLLAKFLTIPRLSKRAHSKKMLPETLKTMQSKVKFLEQLSTEMGWEYSSNGTTYANFYGYRNWRKEYIKDLESVLFSSKKINDFDEAQFIKWFDSLPSQARFRSKNRILYQTKADGSLKYPQLYKWYKAWEAGKEAAQQQQRILEEKVRQGTASTDDLLKLDKVKKEAKVTVGATNFKTLYQEICNNQIDKLKLESFVNKVNLPYNMLTIIDDSGSMTGAPFNFATFLASVCLVKNPDDIARNLLGFFSNTARLYTAINMTRQSGPNMFYRSEAVKVTPKPFVDPKLSFYDNYINIQNFCNAAFKSGGTYLNCIPKYFASIIKETPEIKDALMQYPIWTIVSDGDINNSYNARASLIQFFNDCEEYLGYKPYVIIVDVLKGYRTGNPKQWEGIPNFMYIPGDPNMIEQMLCNFKDMDQMDVHAPLQLIYRSNRYSLIRENTL